MDGDAEEGLSRVKTKPLIVVANLKAKPGKEAEVRERLQGLILTTREEPGCLHYDLHVATGDPAAFLFLESWSSRKHLDDHLARPHVQAFLAQAGDLLVEPPQLTLWEKVGLRVGRPAVGGLPQPTTPAP
jgi:quinol monooxygenase YgiN